MKKGFTLIELLAVIVILAIIALIATPIILGIINDAKDDSNKRSVENYAHAVELAVARYAADKGGKIPFGEFEITSDGKQLKQGSLLIDVDYKGEKMEGKVIVLDEDGKEGQIKLEGIKINGGNKAYNYSEKDGVTLSGDVSSDGDGSIVEDSNAGLYDAEGNLLYSWDTLVNDYGINVETDYVYKDSEDEIQFYDGLSQAMMPGYILSNNADLKNGVKLVVGSNVSKIGSAAFMMNTSLTSIELQDGVESIGFGAFVSSNLVNIKMPNTITDIGEGVFSSCESLDTVVIPSGVTVLREGLFQDAKLNSVVIPKSVTKFENMSFDSVPATTVINYMGTEAEWGAITFETNWSYGTVFPVNYNYVIQ